jgi:hypothetical protein
LRCRCSLSGQARGEHRRAQEATTAVRRLCKNGNMFRKNPSPEGRRWPEGPDGREETLFSRVPLSLQNARYLTKALPFQRPGTRMRSPNSPKLSIS